jgi:hypothetical protein
MSRPALMEAGEEKVESKQECDEIHEGMDVPQLSGKCCHENIADKSVTNPFGDVWEHLLRR